MGEFATPVKPIAKDAKTSLRMQKYARADTKPELMLRKALHRRGLRFRKNIAPVVGLRCKPDVVFTRLRVAVFVDGCFWHGCPQHETMPKNNAEWWSNKLTRNSERDRRIDAELEANGWAVLRIWEHQSTQSACDHVIALVETLRST